MPSIKKKNFQIRREFRHTHDSFLVYTIGDRRYEMFIEFNQPKKFQIEIFYDQCILHLCFVF